MIPRYDELDLRDPGQVVAVLRAATEANRDASCRNGSVDRIRSGQGGTGPSRLIATGDLHDNPVHLARLVRAAGLEPGPEEPADAEASDGAAPMRGATHLTLHEVIHGGRFVNGMDFSFRALVRIAALKAGHPELVHTLLANHELSQIVGAGIVKDGINVVTAFNDAVDFTFGEEAERVHAAIGGFIRSMPLALVCEPDGEGDGRAGRILCAHSLPSPALMDRFDPDVLLRELSEEDYVPRRGSAHLMVWGREQTPEQLTELAARWGVSLFILGHEKADEGVLLVEPNAVVLNSDHERGKMIELELGRPLDARGAAELARGIG